MADRPEPVPQGPADSSRAAVAPVGESFSTAEISAPMLDVHVPHQTVHTWKDFLVHIAAIAIGLLLALALEKLAEYVHERGLLTEARRELALEVADNRRTLALNVIEASRIQQELDADLKVIQALRLHASVGNAKFDYSVVFHATRDGPWQAVQQNGSLNVVIEGQNLKFVKHLVDGKPVLFDYIGQLSHADFGHPLCQIEPEDVRTLDDLYDRKQIFVAGCEPESEYGGIATFLKSSIGQKQFR